MRWAAKPGAPPYIREWIEQQGPRQRATLEYALGRERARLQDKLDEAKESVKRLEGGGSFRRSAGSGLGQTDYVDREAEARWTQQLRTARAKVGDLTRELKQFDAAAQQRREEAERNPKLMTDLIAAESLDDLRVGSAGAIGTVTVYQVVDDENMIVRWEKGDGGYLWCKGFSTAGVVDDQRKQIAGCIISGTRKDGIGRTLFVAEPFNVTEWITLVEATPEEIRLMDGMAVPPQPARRTRTSDADRGSPARAGSGGRGS